MTSQILPPVARPEPKLTHLHGQTLVDNYAWLRQKSSPEVIEYLEAENAYSEQMTAAQAPLREQLYQEMLGHIKQTDVSVAYRKGEWWYCTRTEEGSQYSIYCRQAGSATAPDAAAPEEILLDGNKLAEGESFFAIGDMAVSDDGNWLLYSTDLTGFRQYTLHLKNLVTGETRKNLAERVGSVSWAADNRSFFFAIEDDVQKRQFELYRSTTDADSVPELILREEDERYNIAVGRTRDGRYLILESASHVTSESSYLDATNPTGKFAVISPRIEEQEYEVEHRNGYWFLRTNDLGRNFRLVVAPVGNSECSNWIELLAHREEIMLEDVDLFDSFLIASEREQGLPRLRLWKFCGEEAAIEAAGEICFPEPTYNAYPHINLVFEATKFRYSYQSLVTPSSVYEYDLASGESKLLKQTEVPGGFDRALYASERIFAKAEDGTEIPVSLVYRRDSFVAGRNPLYVYGYGSYGYSLPVAFSSNRLSLLDRGLVLAYAHIRGGGEMGDPWHDAGKMLVKRNTFTDFIASVQALTAAGFGDPARVAIEGGSAGGLLMGAVTNLRPELFRVVLSHVPFVDVMNTMLDATLPLTVPEYEEWGNPNLEPWFSYMLSYSPYDKLKAGKYPAMLVKTSLNDSQVMYWEPAKYVAKLRTLKQDATPLLLVTNMSAGHGGASGRYDYLKEIAFDYAFMLGELGVV